MFPLQLLSYNREYRKQACFMVTTERGAQTEEMWFDTRLFSPARISLLSRGVLSSGRLVKDRRVHDSLPGYFPATMLTWPDDSRVDSKLI